MSKKKYYLVNGGPMGIWLTDSEIDSLAGRIHGAKLEKHWRYDGIEYGKYIDSKKVEEMLNWPFEQQRKRYES